jgi:hypothetical protein
MSSLKPLIFIHPLQATLKELYKVMSENAKDEGVEVYEIDSVAEFCQLFSSVGQSVCLFGNPKKCAQALQGVRNTNKKLHSKILLVSEKNIPNKTMEKFEKIGLTEAIIEPVAPKTLMYKVRLQLKSIITAQEQDEMNRKFGSEGATDNEKKEVKSKEKNKKNNKDSSESFSEIETQTERKERKISADDEEDLYAKNKKLSRNGETIDSHMRGNVKEQKKEDQDESGNSSTDHIDSYIKGKTSTSDLNVTEEDVVPDDENLDDLIDEVKQSLDLNLDIDLNNQNNEKIKKFEEELERQKIEKKKLAISEERERNKRINSANEIEGHLKGAIKDGEKRSEGHLSSDSKPETIDKDIHTGKSQTNLELQSDEDPQIDEDDQLDVDDDIHNRAVHLNIKKDEQKERSSHRDEIDGPMTGNSSVEQGDQNEKDTNEAAIDHIETKIKGSLIHKKDHDENEEGQQSDAQHDLTNQADNKRGLSKTDEENEYDQLKSKTTLDLDANDDSGQIDEQIDDPEHVSKESITLDLERNKKPRKENEVIANTEKTSSRAKSRENALDDDLYGVNNAEKKKKELSGESYTETSKEKHNKADARADKIETHYKGTGNSHKAQEWGSVHNKRSSEIEESQTPLKAKHESLKKNKENERHESFGSMQSKKDNPDYDLDENEKRNNAEYEFDYEKKSKDSQWDNIDQKNRSEYQIDSDNPSINSGYDESLSKSDPGEQTIDYEQLHKEFFNLDNMNIEDVISEEFLYPDEQSQDEAIDVDVLPFEDNLIPAKPQGFDTLLRLVEKYRKPIHDFKDILNFIDSEIRAKTQGQFVFWSVTLSKCLHLLPEHQSTWESCAETYLPFWVRMTKATLMDWDFKDEENYYVIPYHSNQGHFFLAIIMFDKRASLSLNRSKVMTLNTILQGVIPILDDLAELANTSSEPKDAQVRKEFLDIHVRGKVS